MTGLLKLLGLCLVIPLLHPGDAEKGGDVTGGGEVGRTAEDSGGTSHTGVVWIISFSGSLWI